MPWQTNRKTCKWHRTMKTCRLEAARRCRQHVGPGVRKVIRPNPGQRAAEQRLQCSDSENGAVACTAYQRPHNVKAQRYVFMAATGCMDARFLLTWRMHYVDAWHSSHVRPEPDVSNIHIARNNSHQSVLNCKIPSENETQTTDSNAEQTRSYHPRRS